MIALVATLAIMLAVALVLVRKRSIELRDLERTDRAIIERVRAANDTLELELRRARAREMEPRLVNVDRFDPFRDDVLVGVPAQIHQMKRQGHDVVDLSAWRAHTERDERVAEAKLSMDCAVAHDAGCDCRDTYRLFRRLARLAPIPVPESP